MGEVLQDPQEVSAASFSVVLIFSVVEGAPRGAAAVSVLCGSSGDRLSQRLQTDTATGERGLKGEGERSRVEYCRKVFSSLCGYSKVVDDYSKRSTLKVNGGPRRPSAEEIVDLEEGTIAVSLLISCNLSAARRRVSQRRGRTSSWHSRLRGRGDRGGPSPFTRPSLPSLYRSGSNALVHLRTRHGFLQGRLLRKRFSSFPRKNRNSRTL